MSTDLFIELIHISLGARDHFSRTLSATEWASIFSETQRQAIVGVITEGLERLPQEQLPPKEILLQWIGFLQINENSYKLHIERAAELTNHFKKSGIKSSVLKGLGFAQLYPTPSRRQCGDIDLWVDGNFRNVIVYLRSEYKVEHILWHHVDAKIFEDVETEIHYHPCWLYNPFYNSRLQKWFENHKSGQMQVDEKLGFAYPTVQFNAVYSLVHLYHHLIEEGVGVRHIVDYYYILLALRVSDRATVMRNLERFGLLRLARAIMWVLKDVCGMSSEYLLFEPNEKEGRFLLDEIFRGGNFGHYRKDSRRRNSVSRMLALLPHYPKEVLWVVPWKLWHKCWRLVNA